MIGCPPLEEKDSYGIMETRLSRLTEEERRRFDALWKKMKDPYFHKENAFVEVANLLSKADRYDVIESKESQSFDYRIFSKVWPEVEDMRSSGKLLELRKHIRCPLIIIHGEYDPHPLESLRKSLERCKFISLKKCGHRPWLERYAKDTFYQAIENELSKNNFEER